MINWTSEELLEDMLCNHNLLIAGSVGSGKSVLLNSMICQLLKHPSEAHKIVLIDPKRVELSIYKKAPHCLKHETELRHIAGVLAGACDTMDKRYRYMARHGLRKWEGAHIHIFIDELVDISPKLEHDKRLKQYKQQAQSSLIRLASLGRASGMHIIACTQRPTRDIIDGVIRGQFTARVGLRTTSRIESRNIIELQGCETLPLYGYGYYIRPGFTAPELVEIPLTPDNQQLETIKNAR